MDLSTCRERIDRIDAQLVRLAVERLEVSEEIARVKKEKGLAVRDPRREEEKLAAVRAQSPEEYRGAVGLLYERLFALSRARQSALIGREETTPCAKWPKSASVACAAAMEEGAAALFAKPLLLPRGTNAEALDAARKGESRYALLPDDEAAIDMIAGRGLQIVRALAAPGGNGPRLLCVGASAEVFEGADRAALQAELPARGGALAELLGIATAQGAQILRISGTGAAVLLELGPGPERVDPRELLRALSSCCDGIRLLGVYSEVNALAERTE